MDIGMLTSPFADEPLEKVVYFASEAGISALEVASHPGSRHIDPAKVTATAARRINALLANYGVRISSLAAYDNMLHPDPARRKAVIANLRRTIQAASRLGVDVVCTLAGMPLPGKDRMQTIEQDLPQVLRPLVRFAAAHKVKIAFENWTATNIQHLGHWQRVFELVPDRNLGLNFDPSHLFWQQIDYLEAVERFGPRIFHTHAKDTEVLEHRRREVGVNGGGWWRYVIPGYGGIDWGQYVSRLRRVGYDGVLSIEHEDSTLGREEGFRKGQRHLALFV